ncbi:hypothetical protein [Aeromicrobium alkaliterrae]|uniref:Septum formation-related domain-containing protein n=1 Tax=Aeromicrobium alkaliterrae TaxID=302168 RepID=A0ABP4WCL1_9ACTN
MRTWGIAVLLTVVVVVAGCGGGSSDPSPSTSPTPDEAPSVAVGDCLDAGAGESGLTPEMLESSLVVDCAEPHAVEVLAVEPLPEDLTSKGVATLEYRDTLLDLVQDPRSNRQRELSDWVWQTCSDAYATAAGLDAVRVDRQKAVKDFVITDASRTASLAFDFPEESWEDEPRLVCVNRYTEPRAVRDDPARADALDVEGTPFADYLSPDFPVDMRLCLELDDGGVLVTGDCTRQHYVELFFAFDADTVLDDELLETIEATTTSLSLDTYLALDELCTSALGDVIGRGYDADAVTGYAQLATGWADGAHYRTIHCGVRPVDSGTFDLGPGSIVGIKDGEIPLVPIA